MYQQDIERSSSDDQGDSQQYLTFMLNGEEYGVEILRVQGIQGWDSVTPIPNSPEYVLGVMNLLWIAALAAFVLVEKVVPRGHLISQATGLLLAVWGVWMVAAELV